MSAYLGEGSAEVVLLYASADLGKRGAVLMVAGTKKKLTRLFGRPRPIGKSGWEWRYGRRAVRFNWRGRGTARRGAITLMGRDGMDPVSAHLKPPLPEKNQPAPTKPPAHPGPPPAGASR